MSKFYAVIEREELLDLLHEHVSDMSDALLSRLIDAAEVILACARWTGEEDAIHNDLIVKAHRVEAT